MSKQISGKPRENRDPALLPEVLHQLLQQLSRRNQKIAWINGEKAAAERSFSDKEQALLHEIAEKDAILEYTQIQLRDREAQLAEILNSRTWKTALLLQRIRVLLIPPESRRARILQRGLELLSFPFKKTGQK